MLRYVVGVTFEIDPKDEGTIVFRNIENYTYIPQLHYVTFQNTWLFGFITKIILGNQLALEEAIDLSQDTLHSEWAAT